MAETKSKGRAKKGVKGLVIKCNKCYGVLDSPGALMFTPPDQLGQCTKLHLCVFCWREAIEWLLEDQ